MTNYDCVIIPGGGLLDNGTLPAWSKARLDLALSLRDQCRWFVLLSGGTVHKPPPYTEDGFPIRESHQAADYLLDAGIDSGQVLSEISSYDTIGNVYFSRLLFAEPLQLHKLLVITSEFHLPRTRALFEWIYFLPPQRADYKIEFQSSANIGLTPEVLAARIKRETISLANLEITKQKISDIHDFTKWIYTEHKAYNSQQRHDPISQDELKSY